MSATLTQLLQLAATGERDALGRVFAALYPDLRRIAHARLRQGSSAARLETTALVHESFLRLVDTAQLSLADRKHFFTYAAKTMRNIMLELAREQFAQRRGGGRGELQLDTAVANELAGADGGATLSAVNDALQSLEQVDRAVGLAGNQASHGGTPGIADSGPRKTGDIECCASSRAVTSPPVPESCQ
jgi:RNA polymerase sigma factor (TIGR02999 family)